LHIRHTHIAPHARGEAHGGIPRTRTAGARTESRNAGKHRQQHNLFSKGEALDRKTHRTFFAQTRQILVYPLLLPTNNKPKDITMKKQIINISPFQTAKVFAVLYFLMSIPLIGFMAIAFSFSPAPHPGMGMLIIFPFAYLIFGFIFTVIGAWIYNIAANWVGGIEYTSISIEND
jgi:hypothetical protein